MNKKLIALLVGATVVSIPMTSIAAPKVYGKVNVTLDSVDDGSDKVIELNSNASRLGVKGKEALTDDISAVYKLEYEIAVDDGDAVFKQRNIYGGFAGLWGELIAGNFDTPLKVAQNKIDLFNDLSGDVKHIMAGETRASNLIQYTTPSFNGLSAKLAIQPGEMDAAADRDGLADGLSASIAYDGIKGLYLALAMDSEMVQGSGGLDVAKGDLADVTRFVASYSINGLTLGGLFQQAETVDTDNKDTSMLFSAAYKIDAITLKAQYGSTDGDITDDTLTLLGVGADYKLGGSSKVFAYLTKVEQDEADTSDDVVGLGFETKF